MFGKRRQQPVTQVPTELLRCSFCNKSQRDVRKVIAGPNVQICDECVDICSTILNEEKKNYGPSPKESPATAWPSNSAVRCSLCAMPTPPEACLSVHQRGALCPGCIAEVQASMEARTAPES